MTQERPKTRLERSRRTTVPLEMSMTEVTQEWLDEMRQRGIDVKLRDKDAVETPELLPADDRDGADVRSDDH